MSELQEPNWNRCPGPAVCFALQHASESSLRALVVAQAQQLDRVLLGGYVAPDPDTVVYAPPGVGPPASEPTPDENVEIAFVVTALMEHEDIYRKPARVAAPRLLERLNQAGLTIVKESA